MSYYVWSKTKGEKLYEKEEEMLRVFRLYDPKAQAYAAEGWFKTEEQALSHIQLSLHNLRHLSASFEPEWAKEEGAFWERVEVRAFNVTPI